jgi:RNA polymerase subunit RPABC4/transcription elongation factor Spt4
MAEDLCADCSHAMPPSASVCPHCARPSRFPNVHAVARDDETSALAARFDAARREVDGRGAEQVVRDFMTALDESKAVLARPLGEAQRLASSEKQGYATYYQLNEAEVRLPDGDKWDALRRLADEALFPGYKEKVRFAALTLDAVGLSSYGECSMTLRTSMIAHRATLLEENSSVFMERRGVKVSEAASSVRGYRSSWAERDTLCVAKLGRRLAGGMKRRDFAALLLERGETSADDEFVEVHVFGPMTIRSFERVAITRGRDNRLASKPIRRALEASLAQYGVALEVRA